MTTSIAQAKAPAKEQSGAPLRRLTILSGAVDSAVDVRKACNGIKRTASLSAAAMLTGIDPKHSVELAESMAMTVLRSIGFDVDDEDRLASVLPMMIEASCLVLADAAHRAKQGPLVGAALSNAATLGTATIIEVVKSRPVAKMVEAAYPADIDAIVALRLTAAAAISNVAIEIAEFDFAHSAVNCIREAGKTVVSAALEAADKLAPRQASRSTRLILSQSLIHSAAKVYGAAWKAVSRDEMSRMNELSDSEWEEGMRVMEKTPVPVLLAPVNARFSNAFAAITDFARSAFEDTQEPAALRRPSAARPR